MFAAMDLALLLMLTLFSSKILQPDGSVRAQAPCGGKKAAR